MQHTKLESRGIRLHPALWELIDREAKKSKLRTTDLIRRRVEESFNFDPEGHDVPAKGNRTRKSTKTGQTFGGGAFSD